MLKSKKIIACIIGIMLVAALFLSTTAYTASLGDTTTNYYDVVNTPEWSKMTRVERVSAAQLSNEQLQSLSTDELVQAVLDYPFFVDSHLFNTIREDFLRVLGESTALQELLDREDVAQALIDRYAAIDVAAVLSAVNSNNTCFSELWSLEILLAQPEITDTMNERR